MAVFSQKNNYFTDFEDTGLFSGGSVVADVFADIVPELAPLTTAAATKSQATVTPTSTTATVAPVAAKTTTQVIQDLVSSGTFEQNPNQAQLIGDTYYQPVFNSTGSGETFEQGPLQNVLTYKEAENKVGGNVNQYSPAGQYEQTTQQQEVNATKDFMEFLAMSGAMFGAPAGIGEALGLGTGTAAQAVGQGLLTTGTQLGSGASLGDALTAGLKSGAVPIANVGLSQIPDFNTLSPVAQATISSAVGNTLANGGQITPGVILSAIAAGVQADKANIGALEGLTSSGRTGDDMGGVYEPTTPVETPVASVPSGIQLASLGETPFRLEQGGVPIYAESSNASTVKPPAGYELMSAKLTDNKPAGAYYNGTLNAWLQPTGEFDNVLNSSQFANDANLFNTNVNTLDANIVKSMINDSLSTLPKDLTLDDITRVISEQNFATPQDIQDAISSINIPQGLNSQDVQSIVSTALANNPRLTTQQVSEIVSNAVSQIPSGLTASDVTKILGQQNYATPQDIQNAINSIDIPQGLTKNDVESIVSTALTNNPSLTSNQVSQIVNDAVSKLPTAPTTQDIMDIIGSQGLASNAQLTQQGQELMTALQKQGVDYNTALKQALQAQSSNFQGQLTGVQTGLENKIAGTQSSVDALAQTLGKTKESLLAELNMTEADLQKQISGLQSGLGSQISNLSQQTQQQLAQQSAQTQQQFSTLSDAQKAQADALVKQGASLSTAINQVQTNLGQQINNLSQQTQQQLAQQNAATQQQFAGLNAAQKAQADALVNQGATLSSAINQVQAGLGTQISNLSQQTQNQLAQQSAQTQQQFNSLTAAQKAQADALVSQGASFNTALNQVQSGLQSQIAGVQSQLGSQSAQFQNLLSQYESAGLTRDEALQKAINDLSTGVTSQIGNVQSTLESQLSAQNQQFMDSLQQQGVDYQTALEEALAKQNQLTDSQLSNIINSTIGLFTSLGAQGAAGGGGGGGTYYPNAGFTPMQPMPAYSPEYFAAIQQNYNQLLPAVPQDVATPLANWYNTQYGA